jgi:hypothetical protein
MFREFLLVIMRVELMKDSRMLMENSENRNIRYQTLMMGIQRGAMRWPHDQVECRVWTVMCIDYKK